MGNCTSSIKEKVKRGTGKKQGKADSREGAQPAGETPKASSAERPSVAAPSPDPASLSPTDLGMGAGASVDRHEEAKDTATTSAEAASPSPQQLLEASSAAALAATAKGNDGDSRESDVGQRSRREATDSSESDGARGGGATRPAEPPGGAAADSEGDWASHRTGDASPAGKAEVRDDAQSSGSRGRPEAGPQPLEPLFDARSPARGRARGGYDPFPYPSEPDAVYVSHSLSTPPAGLSAAVSADVTNPLPPFEWVKVPARTQWERARRTQPEAEEGRLVPVFAPALPCSAVPVRDAQAPSLREPVDSAAANGGGDEAAAPDGTLSHPHTFYFHTSPLRLKTEDGSQRQTPTQEADKRDYPRRRSEEGSEAGGDSEAYSYSYSYTYSYTYTPYSGSFGRDSGSTYSASSAGSSFAIRGGGKTWPQSQAVEADTRGRATPMRRAYTPYAYPHPPARAAKDMTPVTYLFQTLAEGPVGQRSVFQLDEMNKHR